MGDKTALIVVDVQNDFLPPNGSLAVPGGREVIPVIQKLLKRDWDVVVASQVSLPYPFSSHFPPHYLLILRCARQACTG